MEIRFTSDALDTYRGFAIDIQLQACRLGQLSCDDQKQCISASNHCDGTVHCNDGSDEAWKYCYPECGKSHHDFFAEPGRIVGGDVANEYSIPVTSYLHPTSIMAYLLLSFKPCFLLFYSGRWSFSDQTAEW